MTDDDRQMLREVHAMLRRLLTVTDTRTHRPRVSGESEPVDLDAKNGDPTVKILPRSWRGEDVRGRKYSQCPAGFLKLLADTLEWSARRNIDGGNEKFAAYDGRNAARARGWAKRLEERQAGSGSGNGHGHGHAAGGMEDHG